MTVTASAIRKAEDKLRAARKAVWKHPILSYSRKMAELKVQDLTIELRKLRAQYQHQKLIASAGGGKAADVDIAAAAKASGLTEKQLNMLIAAIRGLMEQTGADQSTATSQVLATQPSFVRTRFPHHLVRRFGRPLFRPIPGTVPPVARSLDPVVIQQGINPRARGRSIDPFVPGHSIDPIPPGISVPAQSGAFQFPPSAAATVDQAVEEQIELAAAAAQEPWYMDKRYWAVGAAVAALAVFSKKKSAKAAS